MYKRIFFIADIHFGIYQNSLIWQNIHTEYFNEFFVPLIQKEKEDGDCLFVLGDIFDSRNTINVATMNLANDVFEKVSKELDVFVVLGNHDIYFKDNSEVNSTICFDKHVKKIYKDVELFEYDNSILIAPWQNNKAIDVKDGVRYILTHSDINGMQFNDMKTIDEGVDFPENVIVISGHIHLRQKKRNKVYVGSPMGLTRISAGRKHGIYRLDIESGKMKFFENTVSPVFLNINYDDYMLMSEDEFKMKVDNNFVNMFIPAEMTNMFPYKTVQELAKGAYQIKFKPIANEKEVEELEDLGEIVDTVNKYDLFYALKKYIGMVDMDNNDRSKVKTEIIEINKILKEK